MLHYQLHSLIPAQCARGWKSESISSGAEALKVSIKKRWHMHVRSSTGYNGQKAQGPTCPSPHEWISAVSYAHTREHCVCACYVASVVTVCNSIYRSPHYSALKRKANLSHAIPLRTVELSKIIILSKVISPREDKYYVISFPCGVSSVQFSRSVVSNSLRPQASLSITNSRSSLKLTSIELVMPPCPSPTPKVHSNSRPLSW